MVITFLNQKGGVGKTSSVFHLGGALARSGRRVLLVDADPQASLTQGFYGPEATYNLDASESICSVWRGEEPLPESLLRPTGFGRLDLLPGSILATDDNVPAAAVPEGLMGALGRFLAEAAPRYDLTLIDCPPNLARCSWEALLASDGVVVPLQPEDFGAQGLRPVGGFVEAARARNPRLRFVGYLITMRVTGSTVHELYEEALRKAQGPAVFEFFLPNRADFKSAVQKRRPVSWHKPTGDAARAAAAVADELLERAAPVAAGRS